MNLEEENKKSDEKYSYSWQKTEQESNDFWKSIFFDG